MTSVPQLETSYLNLKVRLAVSSCTNSWERTTFSLLFYKRTRRLSIIGLVTKILRDHIAVEYIPLSWKLARVLATLKSGWENQSCSREILPFYQSDIPPPFFFVRALETLVYRHAGEISSAYLWRLTTLHRLKDWRFWTAKACLCVHMQNSRRLWRGVRNCDACSWQVVTAQKWAELPKEEGPNSGTSPPPTFLQNFWNTTKLKNRGIYKIVTHVNVFVATKCSSIQNTQRLSVKWI